MTSLVAGAEPGFEPIEGYILRERIGAGGYGEVWLADAPGGLRKAIKFVFGSIDERAGNELRALQRIRAVQHPFILSLERIEIVNNQLIVVTELADGSLLDRYQEFHNRGLIGIPRNRLLDYLRDSADALDFLCQKHDLQHLDVKPANLLLVADRIKVGDFGLIKDVHNKSMSVMSGMTPTYAAPEMFDGRPGRFSDQYSLAILYVEMLTGTLPFAGRTTAQLASEHLHKAPNLDSLPLLERPIIGKALSKKPSQRFSSCREFVDQLLRVQGPTENSGVTGTKLSQAPANPPSARQTPRVVQSTPRVEPNPTVSWEGIAASGDKRVVTELPAIKIPAETATSLAPSLFIGVGGTGAEVIMSLRERLQSSGLDLKQLKDVSWIQVDTNEATLQRVTDPINEGRLSQDEIIFLPIRAAQQYRERDQGAFTPLSRRWLYNVPRSQETEGVRPMGMLAFLDSTSTCYQSLHSAISNLHQQQREVNDPCKPIRIYFVGSVHGGTGSVLAIELAFLVRNILSELDVKANVQSILCVGDQSDCASTELAAAAGVACLHEISHYYHSNGLHPGIPGFSNDHSSTPPWNHIYLVHGGKLGKLGGWHSAVEQMTDFLCIDACTALGEVLDTTRAETIAKANSDSHHEWSPWLRMFASRQLDFTVQLQPEQLSKRLTLQKLQEWIDSLSIPMVNASSRTDGLPNPGSTERHQPSNQNIDFLVNDVFREQRWTAQSWVRQCMEYLIPLPNQEARIKSNTTDSNIGLSSEFGDLEQVKQLGLEQLSDALGISIEKSQIAARDLLDQAVGGLEKWLQSNWLQSFYGWGQLEGLLMNIQKRFELQSQSLQSVADRFMLQRETLLGSLYAEHIDDRETKISEHAQNEIATQIRSLKIQASVHHLASKMLLCLGKHVEHTIQVWRKESRFLANAMRSWTYALANELGIAIDSNGHICDTWMPLPPNWTDIRQVTQESIQALLQSMIHQHFFLAIGLKNRTLNTSDSNHSSLPETNLQPIQDQRFNDKNLHQLLEKGIGEIERLATQAGLSTSQNNPKSLEKPESPDSAALPGIYLESQMLSDQLNAYELKLLLNGGAKRMLLLLPSETNRAETIEQWEKNLRQSVTIIELDGLKSAVLCVDGEQIEVSQIVYQLWQPSHERLHLAERLHSRNDVDWIPMV